MDAQNNKMEQALAGATKLSLLQLNGIKLDDKHTILTPDYLENLVKNGQSPQ